MIATEEEVKAHVTLIDTEIAPVIYSSETIIII